MHHHKCQWYVASHKQATHTIAHTIAGNSLCWHMLLLLARYCYIHSTTTLTWVCIRHELECWWCCYCCYYPNVGWVCTPRHYFS